MKNILELSEEANGSIRELEQHLAGISPEQLVETALAITAALYQKTAEGARIKVEFPNGKTEELRFKIKRNKVKN
jgi:hypothetical protein